MDHGLQGVAVHLGPGGGGGGAVLGGGRGQGGQSRGEVWVAPAEVDAAVVATDGARGTGRVRVANIGALAGRGVVALAVRPGGDVGTLVRSQEGGGRFVGWLGVVVARYRGQCPHWGAGTHVNSLLLLADQILQFAGGSVHLSEVLSLVSELGMNGDLSLGNFLLS